MEAPRREIVLPRVAYVAGAILLVGGVATWVIVQNQLAAENITVSEDAERYAGEPVDGPLTAYQEFWHSWRTFRPGTATY